MMHSTTSPTRPMHVQAVIDHPHIADWFFTVKLSDFVEQWLYEALGAEWHWYRFEYQARGSTHAHGCAKLKNDPWLLEQELKQIGSAPSPEQAQALQCGEEATALVRSMLIGWLPLVIHASQMTFGVCLNHTLAHFYFLNWMTLIVITVIL